MQKSLIVVLVLAVIGLAAFIFLGRDSNPAIASAPASSVEIVGGADGTQDIDASQQTGGASVQGDYANVTVEDNALVNTQCSDKAQKNYGLLERNGYNGPMCKKMLATKIKASRCANKGGFRHEGLCVMEWEGTQWRVRVLK